MAGELKTVSLRQLPSHYGTMLATDMLLPTDMLVAMLLICYYLLAMLPTMLATCHATEIR